MNSPQVNSLRELAKKIGLAHSTVSMALKDNPRISAQTRELVKKAAKEFGYFPNPQISSLMSQVKKNQIRATRLPLACLILSPYGEKVLTSYAIYRSFMEGAEERAAELGYYFEMLPIDLRSGMTLKRIESIARARSMGGFFIPFASRSFIIEAALEEKLQDLFTRWRAVAIGYGIPLSNFARVTPDHHFNAMLALDKLQQAGAHRIALVLDPNLDQRTRYRWSSAVRNWPAIAKDHAETRVISVDLSDHTMLPGFLREWRQFQPDAVLWIDQWTVNILQDHDLWPKRLNACLDLNSPPERMQHFKGIDQQPHKIGALAAEMLIFAINSNTSPEKLAGQTTGIEGRWVG